MLWRVGLAAILLNALATRGLAAVTLCEDTIGRSFGASPSEEIWLAEAYLAAATMALPLTPVLLQRLGQRGTLLACTFGYVLSSVGVLQTGSLAALVGWLFLQGLATAPLLPLTQSMLAARFPEERRGLAMALWNGGNVLGALLGSAVAVLAVRSGDWHLVFWLGWYLALLGLWLAGEGPRGSHAPLDRAGVALLALGTLSLALGLNVAGRWPPAWALILLGPTCAAAYVMHARRHPHPALDLHALGLPIPRLAIALSLAFNGLCAGQLEANFVVTELHDPQLLGLRTALIALASVAGVALGGLWFDGFLILSLVVTLVGKAGFVLYGPRMSEIGVLWPVVVSSLGYWMVATALSVLAMKGVPDRLRPPAAALFSMASMLGNTLGLAALDGYFGWRSDAVPLVRAFHEAFWIEWVGVLLLLFIVLQRRVRHGPVVPRT